MSLEDLRCLRARQGRCEMVGDGINHSMDYEDLDSRNSG